MLKYVKFFEDISASTLFLYPFAVNIVGNLWLQMQNLETEVRPYLIRWYEESVMHIHRVVQLLQANVGYLLHAVRNHCCLDQIRFIKSYLKAVTYLTI